MKVFLMTKLKKHTVYLFLIQIFISAYFILIISNDISQYDADLKIAVC